MTTPTPLQRLSEIVEARTTRGFDDRVHAGFNAIRFLASPEAVEVLARAIDPTWQFSEQAAKDVLNTIAEQALMEFGVDD